MSVKNRLLTEEEIMDLERGLSRAEADHVIAKAQDRKTVDYILSNLPEMSEEEILELAKAARYYVGSSEKKEYADCVHSLIQDHNAKIKEMLEG